MVRWCGLSGELARAQSYRVLSSSTNPTFPTIASYVVDPTNRLTGGHADFLTPEPDNRFGETRQSFVAFLLLPGQESVSKEMQNVLFRASKNAPNRDRFPAIVCGGQEALLAQALLQHLL